MNTSGRVIDARQHDLCLTIDIQLSTASVNAFSNAILRITDIEGIRLYVMLNCFLIIIILFCVCVCV